VLSPQARLAAAMHAIFPRPTSLLLALAARVLPGYGGIGTKKREGRDSHGLVPKFLRAPTDRAARKQNEL
jgi:hypothetical protein